MLVAFMWQACCCGVLKFWWFNLVYLLADRVTYYDNTQLANSLANSLPGNGGSFDLSPTDDTLAAVGDVQGSGSSLGYQQQLFVYPAIDLVPNQDPTVTGTPPLYSFAGLYNPAAASPFNVELQQYATVAALPDGGYLAGLVHKFWTNSPMGSSPFHLLWEVQQITTETTREVQTVAISGTPTGGTYTLTWIDPKTSLPSTTAPINYDAPQDQVQNALLGLTGINAVGVATTGTAPNFTHAITFNGVAGPVALLTDVSSLVGGSIAIARRTAGRSGSTHNTVCTIDPFGQQTYAVLANITVNGGSGLTQAEINSNLPTIESNLSAVNQDGTLFWPNSRFQPAAEVQLVSCAPSPATAGTYTITTQFGTTAALPFSASPAQIQAALRLLAGLSQVTVASEYAFGYGQYSFSITFNYLAGPLTLVTIGNSTTGGTFTVSRTQSNPGVAGVPPGYWKVTGSSSAHVDLLAEPTWCECLPNGALVASGAGFDATGNTLLVDTGSGPAFGGKAQGITFHSAGCVDDSDFIYCTGQTSSPPTLYRIQIGGAPISGSFTITVNGHTTTSLAFNASQADVQSALQALPGLATATVFWSGTSNVTNILKFPGQVFQAAPGLTSQMLIKPALSYSVTGSGDGRLAVQRVGISGSPTAGSYTISWVNASSVTLTTAPIAWNAAQADVQSALRALAGLGSVTVFTTGTTPNFTHTITFSGVPAPVALATVNSSLTGGSVAVQNAGNAVTETQVISAATGGLDYQGATGGTYVLSFNGQSTTPIAYNASQSDIQAAIQALPGLSTLTVSGHINGGNGSYTISFTGIAGPQNSWSVADNQTTGPPYIFINQFTSTDQLIKLDDSFHVQWIADFTPYSIAGLMVQGDTIYVFENVGNQPNSISITEFDPGTGQRMKTLPVPPSPFAVAPYLSLSLVNQVSGSGQRGPLSADGRPAIA